MQDWGKPYSEEELAELRARDPKRWARILSNRQSMAKHRARKRSAARQLAGGQRKAGARKRTPTMDATQMEERLLRLGTFGSMLGEVGGLAGAADAPCTQNATAGGAGGPSEYDLRLHLWAILIMLLVSLAGSLGPIALHLSTRGAGVGVATRLGALFGCGTILATALIHMLPPAVEALQSPCLPSFFVGGYGPWAYLFVLVAMLGMHLLDFLMKSHHWRQRQLALQQVQAALQQQQAAQRQGDGHACLGLFDEGGCHAHHLALVSAMSAGKASSPRAAAAAPAGKPGCDAAVQAAAQAAAEEGLAVCSSDDCAHSGGEGSDLCCPLLPRGDQDGESCSSGGGGRGSDGGSSSSSSGDTSRVVGVFLAEAGIIFHSVMIGMTLGVTGGPAFRGLLLALSLHQLFEGVAIGSAAVDSGLSASKSACMGLSFSVTTPAGIAVGIAVRETFDKDAGGALLAAGIADAVSAGVLIYVALCGLLTPMLTDSQWLRRQRWPLQAAALGAVYSGAGVMALLGRWI
ncbi:ZIP Zinc transporter [Micractinium conductrix]|uniref:ZIP Zinc transporter n=1 Tax=Micractinium conductrix TaxID=554055 RepID=A0A2P6VJN2_9CHLO|nr:ZIP Zinc transporter [Micractinium conductrix]|eukprot:PSC74270.1 ZIP Zinc transporter [Micractinium conductrix]